MFTGPWTGDFFLLPESLWFAYMLLQMADLVLIYIPESGRQKHSLLSGQWLLRYCCATAESDFFFRE